MLNGVLRIADGLDTPSRSKFCWPRELGKLLLLTLDLVPFLSEYEVLGKEGFAEWLPVYDEQVAEIMAKDQTLEHPDTIQQRCDTLNATIRAEKKLAKKAIKVRPFFFFSRASLPPSFLDLTHLNLCRMNPIPTRAPTRAPTHANECTIPAPPALAPLPSPSLMLHRHDERPGMASQCSIFLNTCRIKGLARG